MAAISDLTPLVLPEVPGASIPLVESVLLRMLRAFCATTRIWSEQLTAFNTVAGTRAYVITTPVGSVVDRIESVTVDGQTVEPSSIAEIENEYQSTDWQARTGRPLLYYTLDGGATINFFPLPSSIVAVKIRTTLKPSATATSFPDFIKERYADAIVQGAKAELMLMGEVAWSNPNLAVAYGMMYSGAADSAALDAAKGQTKTRSRTIPRFI